MIEAGFGVEANDLLSQERLDLIQIFVGLGQFLVGVAEDVFHLGHTVAHIERECCAVLAAGLAEDVSGRLIHGMYCFFSRSWSKSPRMRPPARDGLPSSAAPQTVAVVLSSDALR